MGILEMGFKLWNVGIFAPQKFTTQSFSFISRSRERGNEMENSEYERKKTEDLKRRLADARSSIYHIELIEMVKLEVEQLHDVDMKRASAGPQMRTDLDIPESVGFMTPAPVPSTRLVDIDAVRRGKKKM